MACTLRDSAQLYALAHLSVALQLGKFGQLCPYVSV